MGKWRLIFLNCGGDGTLMRSFQKLIDEGLDVDAIEFAVFPFGTSNDLSDAFGWGWKASPTMLEDFAWVLSTLAEAEESYINVWEVIIWFQEGGKLEISAGWNDYETVAEGSVKFLMVHSFSLGIDARIGFHFEQGRTGSKFRNDMRYIQQGLKRYFCSCFSRTEWIQEILSRVIILPNPCFDSQGIPLSDL